MKKRNVGIQAAVAVLFGAVSVSSFAGIAQGLTKTIATQAIVSNATAIATGSMAYSTSVPLPLGTAYVKVTLGNGAKFLQVAGGSIVAGTLIAANAGAATITPGAGVVSADQTSATFPVVITVASAQVATTFTFKAIDATAGNGGVTNVGYLSTVGAVLPVSISVGSSTTVPADIDTVASGNVVTTVNGISLTALSSGASTFVAAMGGVAVETKKIDVVTSTGIALVDGATGNTQGNAKLLNFGGFKFVPTVGALRADALTPFDLTDFAATYGAVLTGNFSAAQGTGGAVFLSASNACATTILAGTVAGSTATFAGVATPGASVPTYVCMQVNTPTNAVTIQPTQPSLVTTLAGAVATTTSTFTSTAASLYNLANNGAVALVKSYIPAAAAGYTSFIRVVNTGAVAAPISVSVVDQTTGVAGPAAVVTVAPMAAGGAATFSSAQLEAKVGAIADATSRPTLMVTAPTTLKVQAYILTNANGNFAEVSGQE